MIESLHLASRLTASRRLSGNDSFEYRLRIVGEVKQRRLLAKLETIGFTWSRRAIARIRQPLFQSKLELSEEQKGANQFAVAVCVLPKWNYTIEPQNFV